MIPDPMTPATSRSMQSLADKISTHMVSERPTSHLFRSRIDNGRKKPEPATHPNVSDISIPNNIGSTRLETAFHQITKGTAFESRSVVRMPGSTPTNPVNTVFRHQLGNTATRNPPTGLNQMILNLDTIGAVRPHVHDPNRLHKDSFRGDTIRFDPAALRSPMKVRRLRNIEHVTHQIDRIVCLLRIDEPVDQDPFS